MHERPQDPQNAAITAILTRTRRIAIVGISDDPWRASHGVALALQRDGYEIVPVNPNLTEVLGERCWPTLADVEGPVDLVDVFRRQEHLEGVTREAAAIGAPAIWLQEGLVSPAARAIAEEAGMTYVEDRCLKVEVSVREARPAAPVDQRGGS